MPKLHSIAVSGYKSIRELQTFELRNLNVLIGANGAGKSNFIGMFALLDHMRNKNLQAFVQYQGGPDALLHFGRETSAHIRAKFTFEPIGNYQFTLAPTNDNRFIFKFEKWASKIEGAIPGPNVAVREEHVHFKHSESSLSPPTDRWRIYHFQDTSDTAKLKRIQATNDNLVLKPDGANLAPYLRMLREQYPAEYRRIVDTINLVAPYFDDFVYRSGEPEYVQLEWTQKGHPDTPFKAHVLSDGTLRFICLTTLLLQPIALLPDTVLIDEPELGLHPYALAILADIFQEVSSEKQLIVSTHSVELINALEPEDIVVVESENGASTFKRCNKDELAGWLEDYSLGELWLKNVLGGRP
jgi:predicted ATPase